MSEEYRRPPRGFRVNDMTDEELDQWFADMDYQPSFSEEDWQKLISRLKDKGLYTKQMVLTSNPNTEEMAWVTERFRLLATDTESDKP